MPLNRFDTRDDNVKNMPVYSLKRNVLQSDSRKGCSVLTGVLRGAAHTGLDRTVTGRSGPALIKLAHIGDRRQRRLDPGSESPAGVGVSQHRRDAVVAGPMAGLSLNAMRQSM